MDPTTEAAKTFVEIYDGQSIVGVIVDTLKTFATGITGTISESFNALILTSDGKLSAFAIWGLSMFGLGLGWKIVKVVSNVIRGRGTAV